MTKTEGLALTAKMRKCETDGRWIGVVLEVPGAMSQAATEAELVENLKDAVEAIFASYKNNVIIDKNFTAENSVSRQLQLS